jgi:hypothetical protein
MITTRNGTVTLFAALDYLQGKVIAQTAQKHTHRQCLEFLEANRGAKFL